MFSFGVDDGITDVAPKSSQHCAPIAEEDSSNQCIACKQSRASGGKKKKSCGTLGSRCSRRKNVRGKGTLEPDRG